MAKAKNTKKQVKKMAKSDTYLMGVAVILAAATFATMMFLMVVIF